MSHFSDSRDPAGIGFLILQDHGYEEAYSKAHQRGGLVGVRVKGRRDQENEDGSWKEDEYARGVIGGASFWAKEKTNAGAWQFGYAAICADEGMDLDIMGPAGEIFPHKRSAQGGLVPRGGSYRAPPDTSLGGGSGEQKQPEVKPAAKKKLPTAEELKAKLKGKGGTLKYKGTIYAPPGVQVGAINPGNAMFGFQAGGWLNPWPNAGKVAGVPNPAPGFGGGANLFGVAMGQWLNPVFQMAIPNIWVVPGTKGDVWGKNKFYEMEDYTLFGLGVAAYNINTTGAASHRDIMKAKVKDEDKLIDSLNEAWMSVESFDLKVFPSARSWTADGRHTAKQPSVLTGWPDFPRGYAGYVQQSTTESGQHELFCPCDPRLVAVNVGAPFTCGTVVTDLTSDGYMDVGRSASLQSMMRVVKTPNRGAGSVLWKKRGRQNEQNWIAWNLGLSGNGDTYGGIVCDLADDSTTSGESRVFGMVSIRDGGPFDVGSSGDLHRWGEDGDGNPINSLHISTDALYRVRGSGVFDGPIFFEYAWPDPGELDYPVHVHWGFDLVDNQWKLWTTSLYTTTPPYKPEPTEPPHPDPVPTPKPILRSGGGFPPRQGGFRDPTERRVYGVTHMDVAQPALSFTAQNQTDGEPDIAHTQMVDPSILTNYYRTSPLVARLEAFGHQSGNEWTYTQNPAKSTYVGGTASGGIVFLPPEITLEFNAVDLAPPWATQSTSYFVAAPGTYFAAGLPELATGGLKTGWRWGVDTAGALNWSTMSATGVATEHAVFRPDGSVYLERAIRTTGVPYTFVDADDVVLASAGVTVTLPDATLSRGRTCVVKNVGAAVTATVDTDGGTIDGDATQTLADGEAIQCISDGSDWWVT